MDFSAYCLTALQVLGMFGVGIFFGIVIALLIVAFIVNKLYIDGRLEVKENER